MPKMLQFFWIFAIVLLQCSDAEVIQIDQGFINGTILKSRSGISFHAFYGLPYAAPPVGSLRFEPPAPPPSWSGIRQATQKFQSCLQISSAIPGIRKVIFSGVEDCLYLSVFTKQIKPQKLLPVLVYLHGGGFRSGNGDMYGPHVFMDKPLVMVSFNHRLGVFGYFSSGNATIPGNFGLKDQVAALKWVQKNINRFGGDPNSITILGHNSGAACAHLHTVSTRSKGLFHRVIIESGNAIKYFIHDSLEDTKTNFAQVLEKTSCNRGNINESVSCLKSLPADFLNKIVNTIPAKNKFEIKYQPIIENNDANAFLTANDHYQAPYISAIVGFNSAEGLNEATNFFKIYSNITELNRKLNEDLPLMLQSMKIKEDFIEKIGKTVMKYYFTDGIVTENDGQNLCNLLGDIFRSLTMMDMILTYPGKKYFYIYDYKNAVTMTRQLFNDTSSRFGITGAGHSDELLSLFSTNVSDQLTVEDRKLSEQIITYWVNFMNSGNPNQPERRNTEWNPTNENFQHLHISKSGFKVKSEPLGERYKFWSSLIKNLRNE